MQQKITIAEGLELDFSGLFAPKEQASRPETTPSAEPNVFAEEDALIEQGYKKVPFEDTPFAQASEKPSRSAQSSPAKESKASTLQASGAAVKPQKKALFDSTGTINYSEAMRTNYNFLERNTPPPIDEAYYKGLAEDDLRAVAAAVEKAQIDSEIYKIPKAPTEEAYWKHLEAEREDIRQRNEAKPISYLNTLLSVSVDYLASDYLGQLGKCLDNLHAFDLLETETACKEE